VTGDQVLRLVAMSMKQNVKGQDIAARYGGEDFIVALPKASLPQAITVADHIRRVVMTKELMKRSSGERLGRVRFPSGWRCCGRPTRRLIERADEYFYAAKRSGRNRIISDSDPEARGSIKRAAAPVA
jgi:diguanylate cyclase